VTVEVDRIPVGALLDGVGTGEPGAAHVSRCPATSDSLGEVIAMDAPGPDAQSVGQRGGLTQGESRPPPDELT
jgi:hypothetical protein